MPWPYAYTEIGTLHSGFPKALIRAKKARRPIWLQHDARPRDRRALPLLRMGHVAPAIMGPYSGEPLRASAARCPSQKDCRQVLTTTLIGGQAWPTPTWKHTPATVRRPAVRETTPWTFGLVWSSPPSLRMRTRRPFSCRQQLEAVDPYRRRRTRHCPAYSRFLHPSHERPPYRPAEPSRHVQPGTVTHETTVDDAAAVAEGRKSFEKAGGRQASKSPRRAGRIGAHEKISNPAKRHGPDDI